MGYFINIREVKRVRGRSYIYVALVLILDLVLGMWAGVFIAAAAVIYGFFVGDRHAKKKMGAFLCDGSRDGRQARLYRCFLKVKEKAERECPYVPRNVDIYVIPDERINACAFRNSIGVTEGVLNLDSQTIEALIAHEYGHLANGDSVLNMVMSVSCIGLIALMLFYQFLLLGFIYLVLFLIYCTGGIQLNFFSYMITDKIMGLLKNLGELTKHAVYSICQMVICFIGRRGELRADSFAGELGYAFSLCRFLERFDSQSSRPESMFDVLYHTHPAKEVRIQKLHAMIRR